MNCADCLYARIRRGRVSCMKGWFSHWRLSQLPEKPKRCHTFESMVEKLPETQEQAFRQLVRRCSASVNKRWFLGAI